MKKILPIILLCCVLFMTGCQSDRIASSDTKDLSSATDTENSLSQEASTTSLTESADISDNTATQSQLAAKLADYNQKTKILTENSVSEMVIVYLDEQIQQRELTISDMTLIGRRLNLIAKMTVEARPVEYLTGRGFTLQFKVNEQTISMGGYMLPCIYGDYEDNTMLYLLNYKELQPQIEQLKADTGMIQ